MKNLTKFTRFFQLVFWISVAGLLVNCEEMDTPSPVAPPAPTPNPEEPVQELKTPALVLEINRQDDITSRKTGIKEAIITIRQENGKDKATPTEYERKKIQIEELDGKYLTEKIYLPIGSYQVVAFYVLGEGNSVVEATPLKGSALSEDPILSLPISFEIVSEASDLEEVPIIQLPMKVITVEGKDPKDFGLQAFKIEVNGLDFIYVALVTDANLMDFIPGTLQIIAGEEIFELDLFEGINQIAPLSIAEEYVIKAQSFNYLDFSQTFTLEELKQFNQNPLVIELEDVAIKCVGGDFSEDLVLTTQTELNDWALRCHTGIRGDLTIQGDDEHDPIIDLSALEKVTAVYGSLTIKNTSKLKTLQGLQHLNLVQSWVTIKENNGLETLEGLSLSDNWHINLTISDNPLLVNLKGLDNIKKLGIVFIDSNSSLIDFQGLEQVYEISNLVVTSNESQTSFKGLNSLRHIGSIELKYLDITSFDGFQEVETIGSLTLWDMSKLKDFTGFSGTVTSSLDLMNTRFKSLEGLNVADELHSLSIVDNSLANLRGLSNLKKIRRNLYIQDNMSLSSLEGLDNLVTVGGNSVQILNNMYLTNYCALSKLLNEGIFPAIKISDNGYNPSTEQLKEGECQGEMEW